MAEDRSSSMGNKVDHDSDQPCELPHKFLKKITNDFDKSLIVGRGTFGIVYKGTYENGEEIAVKVLQNTSGFETTEEFNKELNNLRRLKHQNVVKLVGFCNESEKVVAEYNGKQVIAEERHISLCFEYVCNGSLTKHIYADGCSGLNWHILYNIIKGICQGLEYLRHGLEFSVWHLDLKPANVLLDNNMIPKLADFGLSKLLFGDENTRKTINHVGTGGYLPPEYIERGLLTKEFDIFGLGVIIVKLMAGREVCSEIDNMSEKKFINHVHGNWKKKLSETLAPRRLEVYCQQVRTCIKIALKCMNCNRQERPGIQFIVSNLIETEMLIRTRGLQTEQKRPSSSYGYGVLGNASTRIKQASKELRRLVAFNRPSSIDRSDSDSAATRATGVLKFIAQTADGPDGRAAAVSCFDKEARDGLLHRSKFATCIGTKELAFADKLFDALARRQNISGDSINKAQLLEFWYQIADTSFDSRLKIFFDMVDKDADRRVTENEVEEILRISASAIKLTLVMELCHEYAQLIMEELDPNNVGYIELYKLEMLLLQAPDDSIDAHPEDPV